MQCFDASLFMYTTQADQPSQGHTQKLESSAVGSSLKGLEPKRSIKKNHSNIASKKNSNLFDHQKTWGYGIVEFPYETQLMIHPRKTVRNMSEIIPDCLYDPTSAENSLRRSTQDDDFSACKSTKDCEDHEGSRTTSGNEAHEAPKERWDFVMHPT